MTVVSNMSATPQRMEYRSRYRQESGLIDPKKVGAYVTPQRVALLEEYEDGKAAYPVELIPHANHPTIQAMIASDPKIRRRIQLNALSSFNHFTAHLEHHYVNDVLLDLAYGKNGLDFPHLMKRDAYAIYLEEANHAHVADDLSDQIGNITGEPMKAMPQPLFYEWTARIDGLVIPEHQRLMKLLFVVGTETSITGVLSKLPKHENVLTAVRDVIRDHASDEARHSSYFTEVFDRTWPQLPTSVKRSIGPHLPKVINAFLEPDWRAIRWQLGTLDMNPEAVDQVIAESYPEAEAIANIKSSAAGTLALFRRNGVFDDPETLDAFYKSGLL